MRKLTIILLTLVFFLQIVSAGYGFDAFVNGDSHSEISAEYGSSPQVEMKVLSANNDFHHPCDLYCSYYVNGKLEGDFDVLVNGDDGDIEIYNLNIKEKGKEGVKDNYIFDFSCSISTTGICGGDILTNPSIPLTVNYQLNPEQREAKAFIEGALTILNENIKDADSKIQKVENKLRSLSPNVKTSPLQQEVISLRNSHNSLKEEVENLDKIVKQDFDYVLAKNLYKNPLPNEIISNGDKAEDLERELDVIIETHNRISEKINNLGKKNLDANSQLGFLNEENEFDDDINLLIENFKSGEFNDYEGIEQRVYYYSSLLDSLLSESKNKAEQLKSEGNSILNKEKEEICDKYEFCLEYEKFNSIEEICNSLKNLQSNIILENDKRTSQIQNETEEIEKQNSEEGFFSRIINFFKSFLVSVTGNIIDTTPKNERILELSDDYEEYVSTNCGFEIKENSFEELDKINTNIGGVTGQGIKEIEESAGQCCIGGECTSCCVDESCRSNPSLYPIIFVHGHSAFSWDNLDYSINAFSNFENNLRQDGYVPMGILLPDSDINKVNENSWGTIRKPISVRVSYYRGVYDEEGRTIGKEQDKSIDEYSQRLSNIVDLVLHHTGKDKVVIVSHSMGGLVSRNYIKNYGGSEKVHKLVTIGTPNHGVWDGDSAGGLDTGLCGLTHFEFGGLQECKDMKFNSNFIIQLNSEYGSHPDVDTLAIVGNCGEECQRNNTIYDEDYRGDEVVRVSSARLNGARNIEILGNKVSGPGTFHQDLVKNSQVYQETMKFIGA